ncbi:MAG: helix-turn-helix domain-containing protein [Ktedonobacteraceae bacterium]|nr:helix-turn-helix domain-containing protein [Ktedonobacteraceae bacterium]MBO0790018.1 helix-turn-helix domain-containing protein [Ktedonobacteraceae bacterium]
MPHSKQIQTPSRPEVVVPATLLTVEGACRQLNVGRTKLFELIQQGLPVIRLGGRAIRFDPASIHAWALRQQEMWE